MTEQEMKGERRFMYLSLLLIFIIGIAISLFMFMVTRDIKDLFSRIEEREKVDEMQGKFDDELLKGIKAQIEFNETIIEKIK